MKNVELNIDFIFRENVFNLLVAPPAWGKTRLLIDLFKEDYNFVYVSPLRALANEFFDNIRNIYPCKLLQTKSDLKSIEKNIKILITTPELFRDFSFGNNKRTVVIFDEYHLFYLWENFRKDLWFKMIELKTFGHFYLGLTATLSEEVKNIAHKTLLHHFDELSIINLGNNQLKNWPQTIIYWPKIFLRKTLINIIPKLCKKSSTVLVFCRYKREVEYLAENFKKKNLKVLTCVGGEGNIFSQKLKDQPMPNVILSTTVLSHGVNLPSISWIVFTGPFKSLDFWIQMVGRGGRKGEKYKVITFDHYFCSYYKKLISYFKVFMLVLREYLCRLKFREYY